LPALRILITNAWLDGFGGTECTVRDLAFGLLRRGHRPIVYSPTIGKIGKEIEARGIPVIDDLRRLAEPPDIIHGQHFIPTSEALISFPMVPAIYVCHAWDYWVEQPPKFPQIRLYGAVSEAVRDRLVHTEGIPPQKVEVFFNSIDLERIPARTHAINHRPRRALCFTAGKSHLPLLRKACDDLQVQLDLLGGCGERFTSHPERELVEYDWCLQPDDLRSRHFAVAPRLSFAMNEVLADW
jgi:Glycosyltransferase Family 4